MKTGIEIVAEERQRQVEVEGWNKQHDARYEFQELVRAAICYANNWDRNPTIDNKENPPSLWPWSIKWWKPTKENRIKELAKSAALIIAEIDRLQSTT